MLLMIVKMSAIVMLYVCLTYFLWSRYRDKTLRTGDRVLLGVIYGIMAVLSTHFGVNYSQMMLNVRDLGPMSAGLFFDPVSGIIAGLIGGIERYIVGTYFGIGSFTRIACSVSTCLAGFLSAFLTVFIFKRKKPSATYAFFMGAAIEVFHMYVVFVTHRSDMRMALHVVKTCALPMIIFSGIGLALSSLVIRYTEGGFHKLFKRRPVEEVPVSQRFQLWLFAVTAIVLSLNFGLNYHLQTNSALQGAKEDLSSAAIDITESYQNIMKRDGHVSFMSNHVGQKGSFFIYNEKTNSAAGIASYGTNKDELIRLTDEHNSGEFFETDVFGSEGLCLETAMYDGSKLLVWLPNTEIYELRDIQGYETLLSDLLLFTVLYILIAMLVQTIVVNNLDLINKSLNKITGGDLDETVNVYESSEFASLSDDINQTVVALKGYIDAAEKRIEQELLLAHTIQDSALPKNFDFNHKGFEVYATMNPAKEVGGDFYDFFFTDIDRLALVIADVAGKGIPAALFMMRSKTAIRSLAETGKEPADVLERVNNELCRGNEADMFVTVWMGIIDLKSGDITCVNAGHEYPVIKRANGDYELFKDKHGLPLGAMENMKYSEYSIHLDPGDSIYLYTDGVPEAININEEQYGTDRMLKALNSCRDMHLKELLPAVKKDIDDFAGEADQFDDTTMLSLNYFG